MDMKGTVYWQIFSDTWNFFKNHMPPPALDGAESWDKIVETCGRIMDKYRQCPEGEFAKSLLLCVVAELDRLARTTSKERQIEVKGDEPYGTSAEIPRSAAILDAGGASEKAEGEGR